MHTSLRAAALRIARTPRPVRRAIHGLPLQPGYPIQSDEFQKWCGIHGVTQSMGKVGVCWANPVAELLCARQNRVLHHERFGSRLAARTGVIDDIEGWYDRRRRLSQEFAMGRLLHDRITPPGCSKGLVLVFQDQALAGWRTLTLVRVGGCSQRRRR